jgi:hypothetical protein
MQTAALRNPFGAIHLKRAHNRLSVSAMSLQHCTNLLTTDAATRVYRIITSRGVPAGVAFHATRQHLPSINNLAAERVAALIVAAATLI